MAKEIGKHHVYTILMFLIIGFGIFLAVQTSYDKSLQILILLLTTCFYVFSGIFHHALEHDISPKIVIEYVLIGVLGMTIVLFFLKGGF